MSVVTGFAMPWFDPGVIEASDGIRLICLPYAGGNASTYRPWMAAAWPGVTVCPALLPGRERRIGDEPFQRMAALVDDLCAALPTDAPYALFGHSMGALLAYELACALRRSGKRMPAHVFVSGAPAPHVAPNRPPRYRLGRRELIAELAKLGGTPPAVLANDELLDLCLPTVRADFAMLDTYHWQPSEPLDVPLSVFYGSDDAEVDEEDILGWRRHGVDVGFARFRGDHFFVESDSEAVRLRVAAVLSTAT